MKSILADVRLTKTYSKHSERREKEKKNDVIIETKKEWLHEKDLRKQGSQCPFCLEVFFDNFVLGPILNNQ